MIKLLEEADKIIRERGFVFEAGPPVAEAVPLAIRR